MNKCCHYLFGQQFVWVADCYAIKFILSYNCANHTILHLQMRLMGWDVNIVHRNDHYIMDADYWSCLGANLCFNPLFKTYLDIIWMLRIKKPPPTLFPMNTQKHALLPWATSHTTQHHRHAFLCQPQSSYCFDGHGGHCHGLCHLSNIPIKFSFFGRVTPSTSHNLHNDKFPCHTLQVLQLVGGSTPSKRDILLQLFSLETCHSMSKWLGTPTNWDAPCFRNLHHVNRSLVLQTTCLITFVLRGTPLSSMDT